MKANRSNSFTQLLLRAVIQLEYLTPKPAPIRSDARQQPYVFAIVGANIFCMLLHLLLPSPNAGEATRGYLHGSLLLDFVGQLGPTARLHLLCLDVLISTLQLTALAAVSKRKELWSRRNSRQSVDLSLSGQTSTLPLDQDHDAEERGEHHQSRLMLDSSGPLAEPEIGLGATRDIHWLLQDRTASGQIVIIELFIWDNAKKNSSHIHTTGVRNVLRFNLLHNLNVPLRS